MVEMQPTRQDYIAQFEVLREDKKVAVDVAWDITDTESAEWREAMASIAALNRTLSTLADRITPNCDHDLLDCWHYRG